MEQTNTVLQSLDENAVLNNVTNWSNAIGTCQNYISGDSITETPFAGYGNNNLTSTNTFQSYPYLSYPYWTYPYITYTYGTDVTNKVLVSKAENGFILAYNSKTWIAKTEQELAKLIIKAMLPKEK